LDGCAAALEGSGALLREVADRENLKPTAGSPAQAEAAEAVIMGLEPALLPMTWVAALDYASVAVEHAESLAVVLRNDRLITAPAIARAVIEHAQRSMWLLEPTHGGVGKVEDRVTARQRAARGQLEELSSSRHYRDTMEKLAKAGNSDARDAFRAARGSLKKLRVDVVAAFGEDTTVDGELPEWRIEGQALPGLTATSEWFFETMTLGPGLGIYDALSGWTHPTLWGIREHREASPTADGGAELTLSIDVDFIGRLCATTAGVLYRMLCQLAGP
jgi:hypothetical protein